MKETIKITCVLTGVCVICAFLLSLVFAVAKEKIDINAKAKVNNAIYKLAPYVQEIKKIDFDGLPVYRLFDRQGKLGGYAFTAEGDGYQGKIKILAIIDAQLRKLDGIEIVESVETPGLGAKIQEEKFKKQFKMLNISPAIEYVKEEITKNNEIKAITGATISSKAVVNILNERINILQTEIKNKK